MGFMVSQHLSHKYIDIRHMTDVILRKIVKIHYHTLWKWTEFELCVT